MHNRIYPSVSFLEKEATRDLPATPIQQGVPTAEDPYIWTVKVYIFVITRAPLALMYTTVMRLILYE